jgi:hypothetical protein
MMLFGEMLERTGTSVLMVNRTPLDRLPSIRLILTTTDPGSNVSDAGMTAVNWFTETKVVAKFVETPAAIQVTVSPSFNWKPLTVKLTSPVFACTELGAKPEMIGLSVPLPIVTSTDAEAIPFVTTSTPDGPGSTSEGTVTVVEVGVVPVATAIVLWLAVLQY